MRTGILKEYIGFEGGANPPGGVAGGGSAVIEPGGGGQPDPGAPAGGSEPPEGGQPPAGGADPEPEHEVTINGEVVKVKLSELTSGYSRQQDYTTKTTQLADDKKSFEADRQRQIQEGVQAEINRLLDAQEKGGEGAEPPDQVTLLTQKVEGMQTEQADRNLDIKLAELSGKHQGLNEDLLMLEASKLQIKDLKELDALAETQVTGQVTANTELVQKIMADENSPVRKEIVDKIINKYLEDKANPPSMLPPAPGSTTPPATVPDPTKPLSRHELDDAAQAALRRQRPPS